MKRGVWLNVRRPHPRRAGVAVQVAIFSGVMIGFGALAIDLGRLYTARGELQRAADSAALAGASAFFTDAGLMRENDELDDLATNRASSLSGDCIEVPSAARPDFDEQMVRYAHDLLERFAYRTAMAADLAGAARRNYG